MIERIKDSFGFRVSRWYQNRLMVSRHDAVSGAFKEQRQIHTYTTPDELLMLSEFAGRVSADEAIVEIGSYVGASTRYLIYGSLKEKPPIVCVDTWMNETMPFGEKDTFSEFNQNLHPHTERIKMVRSDTRSIRSTDLPDSIGLAFIDGDHSYEAVKYDLSLILPNLASKGFIAFHDIVAYEGVSRCVGELIAMGGHRVIAYTSNLIIVAPSDF